MIFPVKFLPAVFAVASLSWAGCASGAEPVSEGWVPDGLPPPPATGPALCVENFLTPEQGQATIVAALARFPNQSSWAAYVEHARVRMREGARLAPWPRRTPLNAVIRSRRTYDGYSVENVTFESVPGCLVTGNLFRPANPKRPCAALLATHGHYDRIETPADYETHGRFWSGMQARCASVARMGAVVLAIDMFGYGDSMQLVGQDAHEQPWSLTIQLWNAIRAVDFLLGIDGVDPTRIAVSGESGGGTQSFLLTALDDRIALSAPVVMVSSYFFGGCACESGLPLHRSSDHFVNNAMIAAMAAPRPLLMVSVGADWTRNMPKIEFPFVRAIYRYYDAEQKVANAHFADEGHDYGPSKRAALYRFLAKHFDLDLAAVQSADGKIDESWVAIEKPAQLRVFTAEYPIPHHALHDAASVIRVLKSLQE